MLLKNNAGGWGSNKFGSSMDLRKLEKLQNNVSLLIIVKLVFGTSVLEYAEAVYVIFN